MKRIPFTQAVILSGDERTQVAESLEQGALALIQQVAENAQLKYMVEQQSQAMTMLMEVQNRIADVISGGVAEGLSAEDLAQNLTTVLGEYTA